MISMYDVQQLLKRFGIYVYTGNRLGDIDLMELEINELYQLGFIRIDEYEQVKYILKKEIKRLHTKG